MFRGNIKIANLIKQKLCVKLLVVPNYNFIEDSIVSSKPFLFTVLPSLVFSELI